MQDYTAALRLRAPDHEPRATAYVGEMIELAGELESETSRLSQRRSLLFGPQAFDGYGKLSHRSLDDMRAGERIDIDTRKRDPMDFVLWKVGKENEPEDAIWPSPWGRRPPGLASRMLGHGARRCSARPSTIHGGGPGPALPPPRKRDRAERGGQSCSRSPIGGCMSASSISAATRCRNRLAISTTLEEAISQYGGDVVRFYFVRTHLSQPGQFQPRRASMMAASGLERLHNAMRSVDRRWHASARLGRSPCRALSRAAMDDDFNAPCGHGRAV